MSQPEVVYTSVWPNGVTVTAVIRGALVEECVARPARAAGMGREMEISGPRPLTAVEARLASQCVEAGLVSIP